MRQERERRVTKMHNLPYTEAAASRLTGYTRQHLRQLRDGRTRIVATKKGATEYSSGPWFVSGVDYIVSYQCDDDRTRDKNRRVFYSDDSVEKLRMKSKGKRYRSLSTTQTGTKMKKQEMIEMLRRSVTEWNASHLSGANLSGANLSGAHLSGANLSVANLYGAHLSGANLSGANLRWSNLYGANLYGADLSGADLRWADLSGADLRWANLYGANLSGATGNLCEVRSIHCFERVVTYSDTHIWIGCQKRTIDEWFAITDAELSDMSSLALERWRKWEPIIKVIITDYPATESKKIEK